MRAIVQKVKKASVTVSVPNIERLNELITKLKTIKMVESIYRVKS